MKSVPQRELCRGAALLATAAAELGAVPSGIFFVAERVECTVALALDQGRVCALATIAKNASRRQVAAFEARLHAVGFARRAQHTTANQLTRWLPGRAERQEVLQCLNALLDGESLRRWQRSTVTPQPGARAYSSAQVDALVQDCAELGPIWDAAGGAVRHAQFDCSPVTGFGRVETWLHFSLEAGQSPRAWVRAKVLHRRPIRSADAALLAQLWASHRMGAVPETSGAAYANTGARMSVASACKFVRSLSLTLQSRLQR
jgi:hypothetical protein